MSDAVPQGPLKRLASLITTRLSDQAGEARFLCERCGDEMCRMHAGW